MAQGFAELPGEVCVGRKLLQISSGIPLFQSVQKKDQPNVRVNG